jgi:hypothetical protein
MLKEMEKLFVLRLLLKPLKLFPVKGEENF